VSARRIRGADGKDKIQLRLDMGLLQMEVDGRPDGARPNGFESLLDYYEHQRRRQVRADGAESFELDEKACELLRAEGMMYYHRYLAQFVLEDYEAVERDTMRNLRVMDLCARYAKDPSDRFFLEQYRAYVLMMCARARARMAVRDKRPKAALAAVQRGMDAIQAYYKRMAQEEAIGSSTELAILRAMAHEIQARVEFDNVVSDRYTVIDVRAQDRLGLLYVIASTLSGLEVDVTLAKIATEVDQAVDVFYVTEKDGRKVTEPVRMDAIRQALVHAIAEGIA
jgi:hypothetical protein